MLLSAQTAFSYQHVTGEKRKITFWPLLENMPDMRDSVIWSIMPKNCFLTILAQHLTSLKCKNTWKEISVLTNEAFTVTYCPHMNNNSIKADWQLKTTMKQTMIDWFSFSSCYSRCIVDLCNCSITSMQYFDFSSSPEIDVCNNRYIYICTRSKLCELCQPIRSIS